MKQSLQLKLGQHLTMTPQLQQAIRLLQLSSMELSVEIQEALDSNMMLELAEDSEDFGDADLATASSESNEAQEEQPFEIGGGDPSEQEQPASASDIPEELPVDTQWDEIYDTLPSSGMQASQSDASDSEYESAVSVERSLEEHLMWQINVLHLSDSDRAIALTIIDALNHDGYLTETIESIGAALQSDAGDSPEEDEIGAVLKLIQGLDPVGVGARDLGECLTLQLAQFDPATKWLNEARRCCTEHMDLLGARDYNQLSRRLKLSKPALGEVMSLIQSLNPRPGSLYNTERPEYIVPDVFVRKHKDRWLVELNSETMPPLRVNSAYAGLIKRADNSEQNSSMRAHLQEARWFIKNLQSRSETLLKVATTIVERQRAFLEHGDEAMRPLVLHDISEALEMHESTISRVTTRKYMHTPRGIFELKYFFSSHVSTTLGGEASSIAIRAVIKKLIAAENNVKPLSDNKIANLLSDQGVQVARRTVAKYREAMSIPPSNERKRLA
jgi:RNA polymerase sigma-54 factor